MKMALGGQDEFYVQVSSAVAGYAMGMLVSVVNTAQSDMSDRHLNQVRLLTLPTIISMSISAMSAIGSLDMNHETRERFNTNNKTINNINRTLQSMGNRKQASSGGCYIATMAYGDYDHPQVKVLRKFRDEKLAKSFFGRGFIRLYYALSPHLVKCLESQDTVNQIIRSLLDKLVSKVK